MSNEELVEQIQKGIDITINQERLWKQNKGFIPIWCVFQSTLKPE